MSDTKFVVSHAALVRAELLFGARSSDERLRAWCQVRDFVAANYQGKLRWSFAEENSYRTLGEMHNEPTLSISLIMAPDEMLRHKYTDAAENSLYKICRIIAENLIVLIGVPEVWIVGVPGGAVTRVAVAS